MDQPPLIRPEALAALWNRFGLTAKCAGVALLVLVLQIPIMMVHGLRSERASLRDTAVAEISRMWGGNQLLVGPLLAIPFVTQPVGESRPKLAWAYFLPARLNVSGRLETERRTRGIYDAVVYDGRLQLSGSFDPPDWAALGVDPANVRWADARVLLAVSDPKGIRDAQSWSWCGKPVDWIPGTAWGTFRDGLHAAVAVTRDPMPFSIALELAGSHQFALVPTGARTGVVLGSPWPDPGFDGAYLPSKHSEDKAGFQATWSVTSLGRALPQQWTEGAYESNPTANEIRAVALGVNLVPAVDAYRTMDRALKHSLLFLSLVFTAFFTFEMTGEKRLKVLHYLLVGASLCLFYLGLLALSEFVGFGAAYLASATASIALIAGYSASVLGSGRRAAIIVGVTGAVYGYLYFVLQMQDYALLAGTAALFVALGAVMVVTRRWESLGERR